MPPLPLPQTKKLKILSFEFTLEKRGDSFYIKKEDSVSAAWKEFSKLSKSVPSVSKPEDNVDALKERGMPDGVNPKEWAESKKIVLSEPLEVNSPAMLALQKNEELKSKLIDKIKSLGGNPSDSQSVDELLDNSNFEIQIKCQQEFKTDIEEVKELFENCFKIPETAPIQPNLDFLKAIEDKIAAEDAIVEPPCAAEIETYIQQIAKLAQEDSDLRIQKSEIWEDFYHYKMQRSWINGALSIIQMKDNKTIEQLYRDNDAIIYGNFSSIAGLSAISSRFFNGPRMLPDVGGIHIGVKEAGGTKYLTSGTLYQFYLQNEAISKASDELKKLEPWVSGVAEDVARRQAEIERQFDEREVNIYNGARQFTLVAIKDVAVYFDAKTFFNRALELQKLWVETENAYKASIKTLFDNFNGTDINSKLGLIDSSNIFFAKYVLDCQSINSQFNELRIDLQGFRDYDTEDIKISINELSSKIFSSFIVNYDSIGDINAFVNSINGRINTTKLQSSANFIGYWNADTDVITSSNVFVNGLAIGDVTFSKGQYYIVDTSGMTAFNGKSDWIAGNIILATDSTNILNLKDSGEKIFSSFSEGKPSQWIEEIRIFDLRNIFETECVLPIINREKLNNEFPNYLGNSIFILDTQSKAVGYKLQNIENQIKTWQDEVKKTPFGTFEPILNNIATRLEAIPGEIDAIIKKCEALPCGSIDPPMPPEILKSIESSDEPDSRDPSGKDATIELPPLEEPNPFGPTYWKKWSRIATTVNLNPMYWPVGILVPTPTGITKIPTPIIWKHIITIPLPKKLLVFFIGQCGMLPSPFLFELNPENGKSQFKAAVRPQKIIKESGTESRCVDIDIIPRIDIEGKVISTDPNDINLLPELKNPLLVDDIPTFKRLKITNLLLLNYMTKFCAAGKKGGGFFENP